MGTDSRWLIKVTRHRRAIFRAWQLHSAWVGAWLVDGGAFRFAVVVLLLLDRQHANDRQLDFTYKVRLGHGVLLF